MKNVYTFKGKNAVFVPKIGKVKPGDSIETDREINHPHFEKVKSGVKKVKKQK